MRWYIITYEIFRIRFCIFVEPTQLIPYLVDFLGSHRTIAHGSLRTAKFRLTGRQIHRPLRVRESRLRAVRRRNIQVMTSNDQIHELTILTILRYERRSKLGRKLMFQIIQNDRRLEYRLFVLSNEAGHFSQRIRFAKKRLGKIIVLYHHGFHICGVKVVECTVFEVNSLNKRTFRYSFTIVLIT